MYSGVVLGVARLKTDQTCDTSSFACENMLPFSLTLKTILAVMLAVITEITLEYASAGL